MAELPTHGDMGERLPWRGRDRATSPAGLGAFGKRAALPGVPQQMRSLLVKLSGEARASSAFELNLVLCFRPSSILLSCGIPYDVAQNALRLSVGRDTTRADVDLVVQDLVQAVAQLDQDQAP